MASLRRMSRGRQRGSLTRQRPMPSSASAALHHLPSRRGAPMSQRRQRTPYLRRNLPGDRPIETWDTRWQPRGPGDARRSVLRVRASTATSGGRRAGGVLAAVLVVRFVDHSGRKTAFWTDAVDMRVCGMQGPPKSALPDKKEAVADGIDFSFDISAIVTFLRRFPEKVIVALELYACASSQLRAPGHALRPRYVAEIDIFNSAVDRNGMARQREEVVPLVPSVGAADEVGERGAATHFQTVAGPCPAAVKSAMEAGLMRRNAEVVALDSVIVIDEADDIRPSAGAECGEKEAGPPALETASENLTVSPDTALAGDPEAFAGSVLLRVRGGPEWLTAPSAADDETKRDDVHVMLTYYSPALPWWNGIVRRDFCCPWCNSDFRRLRTLLVHFQSEHQNAKLMFDSLLDERAGLQWAREGRLPVVVNVSVFHTKHGVRHGNAGGAHGVVKVAPLAAAKGSKRKTKKTLKVRPSTSSDSIDGQEGSGTDAGTAQGNEDVMRKGSLSFTAELFSNEEEKTCFYCKRAFTAMKHDHFDFCGEWCEVIYKSGMLEISQRVNAGEGDKALADVVDSGNGDVSDKPTICGLPPLSQLSTRQRPRKIDFDAVLGRRVLYHVVSTTRFKKTHFDENDPDSEDEVDHSWRLQLSEDSLRELPLPSKHKVLWTFWNRFMFKDGSPGEYGDQYSQHACELFVLEVGPEIQRLGLRIQMIAFLRALHVHGCIDGEAMIAIVDCLDGRRKRRDCRASRRPRPPSGLAKPVCCVAEPAEGE